MADANLAAYERAAADRQKHIDAVLDSKARKRVVVAGPGTGKTTLFKEILKRRNHCLTLTFINTLVEDLALELGALSDVKTLHGFARSALAEATGTTIQLFGELPSIIEADARFLGREAVSFEALFQQLSVHGDSYDFYKKRKDYYGYYGFPDMIFAAIKYFEINLNKLPSFDQIVVDEFQDFNALEVALINLLSERSPIVLAGDDDQALYGFKQASPDYIRERNNDKILGYEAFKLPYCSRCTRVIVDASNDVLTAAATNGHLKGRISKPYLYFDCADKDADCKEYPKIAYARLQARQIPWFIEKCIKELAGDLKKSFTSLIISPANIHVSEIAAGLRSKGFRNVSFAGGRGANAVNLVDGLKLIMDDSTCNLGWRIAAEHISKAETFAIAIESSQADTSKRFQDLIEAEDRIAIRKLVADLRRIRDGGEPEGERLDSLLQVLRIKPRDIALEELRVDLISSEANSGDPAIRKMPIRISTIQGSKGLAEDFVFITHFDDQYYLPSRQDKSKFVDDQSICKFLVALTRARKKVFLLSSDPTREPTFLKWISTDRTDLVFDVNRQRGH